MKSKTKVDRQAQRKTNQGLVETIIMAKKHEKWFSVAEFLSRPRSMKISINLDEIDKKAKEGDTVVVPGKILGQGDMNKKVRIVALSFSQEAEKKLKAKKCELVTIKQEIEKNPKAQGVKLIWEK